MLDEDIFKAGQCARLAGRTLSDWPSFYDQVQVKIWGWGFADPHATI